MIQQDEMTKFFYKITIGSFWSSRNYTIDRIISKWKRKIKILLISDLVRTRSPLVLLSLVICYHHEKSVFTGSSKLYCKGDEDRNNENKKI